MRIFSIYDFQRNIWQHLRYPVRHFYSQLTLPCRDVFRATIANGTSLHKEYTVLVDYAIVSSVEKEADKTDL